MGIRRALIVPNHSEHMLFIRYQKVRGRLLGWVGPGETGRFAVGDQSGHTSFTLTAESSDTADVWQDRDTGDFHDYQWEIFD